MIVLYVVLFCYLMLNTICNQPLQIVFAFLEGNYFPKINAPKAKPSNKAPMIIIAV
jgi:hypothetical protein